MAPTRQSWDDESDDAEESSPASSPPAPVVRRGKFEDEEEEDVLDTWEEAEDSEVEREKAKKAAEEKAKAEAEAKANKKPKAQRIEERRVANMRRKQEDEEEESEEETEEEKRARLRAQQKDADLKHAQDLFGDIGISKDRSAVKPVRIQDPKDSANSIDLSSLSIFNPSTRDQFAGLRETLAPLLAANAKKAPYTLFMQEFVKDICRDLPSDQIKKISSALATLSNEKMKEEKTADKGGKKTKAAKTKTSLVASRDVSSRADTKAYDDDGLGDDDFM